MAQYAGIGSRRLSKEELTSCRKLGAKMALEGHTLRTGACIGADQAFAEGALTVGGSIVLCLPWYSYEKDWVNEIKNSGLVSIRILQDSDKEAFQSVAKYHPKASVLSSGVRRLHARNFLIISGCDFVLAWPKPNKFGLGGTGQGMKIAEDHGIKVINLNNL